MLPLGTVLIVSFIAGLVAWSFKRFYSSKKNRLEGSVDIPRNISDIEFAKIVLELSNRRVSVPPYLLFVEEGQDMHSVFVRLAGRNLFHAIWTQESLVGDQFPHQVTDVTRDGDVRRGELQRMRECLIEHYYSNPRT